MLSGLDDSVAAAVRKGGAGRHGRRGHADARVRLAGPVATHVDAALGRALARLLGLAVEGRPGDRETAVDAVPVRLAAGRHSRASAGRARRALHRLVHAAPGEPPRRERLHRLAHATEVGAVGLGRTAVALGLGGGTRRGDEGVLGGVGCGDRICCRRAARADEEQDGSGEERSRPAPQHRGPPRSVISTAINSPINPLLYLTCEIFRAAPAARGGTRDEIADAHAARPVTPPRSGTQPAGTRRGDPRSQVSPRQPVVAARRGAAKGSRLLQRGLDEALWLLFRSRASWQRS